MSTRLPGQPGCQQPRAHSYTIIALSTTVAHTRGAGHTTGAGCGHAAPNGRWGAERPAHHRETNPAVRGWDGPQRYRSASNTRGGHLILLYVGFIWIATLVTHTNRCRVLLGRIVFQDQGTVAETVLACYSQKYYFPLYYVIDTRTHPVSRAARSGSQVLEHVGRPTPEYTQVNPCTTISVQYAMPAVLLASLRSLERVYRLCRLRRDGRRSR